MRFVIVCFFAFTLTCASARYLLGGPIERSGPMTPQIQKTLLNSLAEASKQNGLFQVDQVQSIQLLKHTTQVVNGLLETYVFKFQAANGTHVSTVTIWNAPWEAKTGLTSACILNLSNANDVCDNGENCTLLAQSKGTCVGNQ